MHLGPFQTTPPSEPINVPFQVAQRDPSRTSSPSRFSEVQQENIYKTTSMNDTMSVHLSEVLKVSQYSEPHPTTTLFMRPHSFDPRDDFERLVQVLSKGI